MAESVSAGGPAPETLAGEEPINHLHFTLHQPQKMLVAEEPHAMCWEPGPVLGSWHITAPLCASVPACIKRLFYMSTPQPPQAFMFSDFS